MIAAANMMSTAQALRAKGVEYLWHMTHVGNLQSVMRHGLLSHTDARATGLLKQDISDGDVQRRRAKREPVFNRPLHDFVPFYLNPKNAMLFCRQAIQRDICILGISVNVLDVTDHLFSDGNAACYDTQFSRDPADVELMPWEVLYAPRWNCFEDGKRLRCAEVLALGHVPASEIGVVHLYDRTHLAQVASYRKQIVVESNWFF